MISVTFPMRTVSEANSHTHWRDRQRRAKGQREAARMMALVKIGHLGSIFREVPPLVVTLTRLAARQLDDDNLASAFKHVRDGVADALGIDDRDPRVTWTYGQEKAKGYAVRIEIRRAP